MMTESELSRLVGVRSRFTDDSGASATVIVTRHHPDGFDSYTYGSAIEGYSMTLLEKYFTNDIGARMCVFTHDTIVPVV